MTIIHHY